MKQLRQVALMVSSGQPADELLGRFNEQFIIEEVERRSGRDVYFDTFDWRLYRKQMLCVVVDGALCLMSFSGTILATVAENRTQCLFWWDLGPSELRDRLQGIIEMRALLPMTTLNANARHYKVMNHDRKTVARINVRSDVAIDYDMGSPLPELLSVYELRGYGGAFDKLLQMCGACDLEPLNEKRWLAERVFVAARRTPLDYGDKFTVELAATIDIAGAISIICQQLIADIEINRDGVCDDIDSEFLHDFRIGIRRTRSLLSLLSDQLPVRQRNYFKREFKWLGSITGALRDIDVYLLQRAAYLDMLPPSLQSGLESFFAELQRRRQREVKQVREHLTSGRFNELLDRWRHFLCDNDSPLFKGPRTKPCRPLANKLICKRFRAFLRGGDRISDDSPDSDLHSLRIRGKKLRYLLEFFRSFYNNEQMDQFIKQMKKLQDNLGDFNDLSVQQEMLEARLTGLDGHGRQVTGQAGAFGGLIAMLANKRRRVRSAFADTYTAFSSVENQKLLAQLLGADAPENDSPAKSS